jgi:hypothetical protein
VQQSTSSPCPSKDRPGTHKASRQIRWLAPYLTVLVVGLSLSACSSTHQEVRANGDVSVRSGPTLLGWVAMFPGVILVAVIIGIVALFFLVSAGSAFKDSIHSRKWLQAAALALSFPVIVGLPGLLGWWTAANTVLKYQTAVVTASSSRGELTVERGRLIGSNAVRSWKYKDIAEIRFTYIPASGDGQNYRPSQGVVYVRGADRTLTEIFDGSPCTARKLADAVVSAAHVPIHVHSGIWDISSPTSFLTQIRCGVENPVRPTNWSEYPAEVWRVLDLPFLWRWPWSVPIVLAQLVLIAASLVIVARWRASKCPRLMMVAVCALAALGIVAMHIFAVWSYGRWPGALALFVLISSMFLRRYFSGSTLSRLREFLGSGG